MLIVLLMKIRKLQAVDLYTLVQELRQQRPGMVQTSEQYKFCHEAVQIFLKEELAKAAT